MHNRYAHVPGDGPYGSDVPDKYMPSGCRTPR